MTEQQITVLKRNGSIEQLDLDKIHRILETACEGISGVSVSDIEMQAHLSFYNGISTKEINKALIKSAADLISETNTNYQYVAANLLNYEIRKDVWGGIEPPRLYDHVKKMVEEKYYTSELLDFYSEEDWHKLDTFIDHDRDFKFAYIGINEYLTKYCVRNRSLKELTPLETPQLSYILIAATLFAQEKNLKAVKSYYNDISLWNISLPTPIMAGARTTTKQFSSCCLIETADTLESINQTAAAIVTYASNKAGIGLETSAMRAEGSAVKKDKSVKHTGVTPFYRYFESALKSCAQGGVRGASATLYTMLWHLEIEDILVLKNNKGTPDTRVRKLDYGIQINNYLYNRLIQKKNITLFSPHDVLDLYDAFFSDQQEFARLYEKYEKDPKIRKKTIPAIELFTKLMIERKETGRIYIFNVDNVNSHSGFLKPIKMSNLCTEITLLTTPMGTTRNISINIPKNDIGKLKSVFNNSFYIKYNVKEETDTDLILDVTEDISELALCTLSAINLGNIKSLDDLKSICRNAVRGLDNLLNYQDFLNNAAKRSNENYRPLGIGIVNLAYYLAKNGYSYSDSEGHKLIHETMEAIQYYCIEASIELAKERGPCKAIMNTSYGKGKLPIDHYNKNVDKIAPPIYLQNWERLREPLLKYGIRNAVLSCQMPAESSARIMNATNGADQLKALIITKSNKSHVTKQVAPELNRLKNKYDISWNVKSMEGFIKTIAIMQKFMDQSISTSLSYNPANYENNEIPLSILLDDTLMANYYGLKTLYYLYTNDQRDDKVDDDKPKIVEKSEKIEEETCDSCTI